MELTSDNLNSLYSKKNDAIAVCNNEWNGVDNIGNQDGKSLEKLALEITGAGMFDWNIRQEHFYYTDCFARVYGYTEPAVRDRNYFESRIHPDDLHEVKHACKTALETGTLLYHARICWPDGSLRRIKVNGRVFYDAQGLPDRLFGTAAVIWDETSEIGILRKLVDEKTAAYRQRLDELKRSEEQYHKMVEEVQDYAIILLDRHGFILNWNKGAEKIKKYRESEVIGKHFSIFYLPEDREDKLPDRLLQRAIAEGRAIHEGWRMCKDGTKFWGSITLTALHDEHNNIIGFCKVTRDLTELKYSHDKMQQYMAELEFKNRELEQFAYLASHDLQEPLRKIHMFSAMIRRNLDDKASLDIYLQKITSSISRMSDLIKSVLNYSRLSKDGEQMVTTDLNQILLEVKSDFELMIEEKKAVIVSDVLPEITAIPLHINQLFTNLLGNALKFNLTSPIIRISCRMVPKNKVLDPPSGLADRPYAEISVSDNGIGFDQQYAGLIFTMFQRLQSQQKIKGTGIGLALCKKIMEIHGGCITARSEPGKGATFFAYFPA